MSSSLPEERVRDGRRPYCKAPLPAGKDAILADRPKTGRNGSTRWNAILRGCSVRHAVAAASRGATQHQSGRRPPVQHEHGIVRHGPARRLARPFLQPPLNT